MDAVVFDYGGVLTTPVPASTRQWLADEGISTDAYYQVMREWMGANAAEGSPVHRLETGELADAEFERALAERLTVDAGVSVAADGLLLRMLGGLRPDPDMLALADRLRAAGIRVGLLSNSWGTHPYPGHITEHFDPVVISGLVGLRKPDPRIYQLALDQLGIRPDRVVFVDDLAMNVAAAAALGMRAHRHTDAVTTRAALAGLLPEVAV